MKMNKKRLIHLIGIVIFVIVIGKYTINVFLLETYEMSRTSSAKKLVKEYNLTDTVIKLEFLGQHKKLKMYKLIIDSSDFEELDSMDKFEFLKRLEKFRSKSLSGKVYTDIIVLSEDNNYKFKIDYLNGDAFTRNGETYYADGTKVDEEKTSTSYKKEPSNDNKSYSWAVAKKEIKNILKAPSTAKFPKTYLDADIEEIDYNIFVVKSYVDAENSFGAKIRSDFMIKIERTGENTYNVLDIEMYE